MSNLNPGPGDEFGLDLYLWSAGSWNCFLFFFFFLEQYRLICLSFTPYNLGCACMSCTHRKYHILALAWALPFEEHSEASMKEERCLYQTGWVCTNRLLRDRMVFTIWTTALIRILWLKKWGTTFYVDTSKFFHWQLCISKFISYLKKKVF